MAKQEDTPAIKEWVATQENIIKLDQHLAAISNFMERNASAARNPARQVQIESLSKLLSQFLEKLPQIEKEIAGDQLAELKEELAEIQRMERKRTRE
jgi:hypothetical protein